MWCIRAQRDYGNTMSTGDGITKGKTGTLGHLHQQRERETRVVLRPQVTASPK